jgi:hypothetical protein
MPETRASAAAESTMFHPKSPSRIFAIVKRLKPT